MDYSKAVSNEGNIAAIANVMKRAAAGEPITVGFLGGSITMGSITSTPQLCYAYRVYEWWQKHFPNSRVSYVNAGIGATDSQFGCARADSDLLVYKPDFVILEYSVNDENNAHYLETYEGVTRKILSSATNPAMMIVHNVFYTDGHNAQEQHAQIAKYYDIPAVSMKETVYAEVASGRIPNREITPDDLHPNDLGHEMVASVITCELDAILAKVEAGNCDGCSGKSTDSSVDNADKNASTGALLPTPMTANAYQDSIRFRNEFVTDYSAFVRSGVVISVTADGFVPDPEKQENITQQFHNGWTASKAGSKITFELEGSCLGIQYRKTMQLPASIAVARLDGKEVATLDGNFDETWGDKMEFVTVLEHGTPGKHVLEIELTQTHEDDKLPFYLVSVIASGRE